LALVYNQGGAEMPRVRYSAEQIINKLRQAEVLISQGRTVSEAAKELEISDHTYYRWRREYGGNGRLKKLVADLSLDNAILKDAAEGNF
jgi:transposase-like protein